MNIVLIGYRCSGKTAVGKLLAAELGRDFVDTDTLIEDTTGCSIETIISTKGWDYFRKTERRVIEEISRRDNMVMATGGGVILDEENVKNLKRNGWLVWLNGKVEVLKERMQVDQRTGKNRPALTDGNFLEEIEDVLSVRTPLYKASGNSKVDTSTLSVREVAAAIIKFVQKNYTNGMI